VTGFAYSTDLESRETPLPSALPLFGTDLGLMGFELMAEEARGRGGLSRASLRFQPREHGQQSHRHRSMTFIGRVIGRRT
jgi:hypothetical protein